jgi:cytochrome c oxidase assembly factor CtaG
VNAPPAGELVGAWGGDAGVLALLLGAAGLYCLGLRRRTRRPPSRTRDFAFAGAMLVLVAALTSPIDAAARYLLWVHMAQHLLLVQVAAPLLVVAAPVVTMERALPRSARRAYAGVMRRPSSRMARRMIRNPWFAFFALAATWWGWHLPSLYDAAVRHPVVHAAEHFTLLGAGIVWWACLIGPRRVQPFAGLALAFATALHLNVLGALITLAPRALYGAYSGSYGLTALEDQQLGGVLMWATGGFVSLALVAWLVHELLREEADPRPVPISSLRST